MIGLFQVTAQYSNAVLLAILPHINDAAKSLDLSVIPPVTPNHIREFRCDPREGHFGGVLFLTNGCTFWFGEGHVSGFESTHCYTALQDPDQITRFFGRVRISKQEAVQVARQTIAKLGYELSQINSNEPVVPPLEKIGTNVVPHYDITWPQTLPGGLEVAFARVEVNGETKRVERFFLPAKEFAKASPQIDAMPRKPPKPKTTELPPAGIPLGKVSAERQAEILSAVLPKFSKFAKGLQLPLPENITTNHLKEIQCGLVNGKPNVQVILRSDYRFNYEQDLAISFNGPNCYFSFDWQQRGKTIKDFMGAVPPRIEPLEDLARRALKASGYFKTTRFLDEKPIFAGGPEMTNKVDITHFLFYWRLSDKLTEQQKNEVPVELWPTAAVEVDSKTMTIQSVTIVDPLHTH